MLSPQSGLYTFRPEVILLLLDAVALFPGTVANADAPADGLDEERRRGIQQLGTLLDATAKHAPDALVVVHSFSPPDRSPFGILDLQQERGQRARFDALNDALVALARGRANVLLVDQDRLEARHGKSRVRDERLWYMGGVPFSESFLPVIAAEHLRIIRPVKVSA